MSAREHCRFEPWAGISLTRRNALFECTWGSNDRRQAVQLPRLVGLIFYRHLPTMQVLRNACMLASQGPSSSAQTDRELLLIAATSNSGSQSANIVSQVKP
jgi:hypothetical protein